MLSVLSSGDFARGVHVHCSGALAADPIQRIGWDGKAVATALLRVQSKDNLAVVGVVAFRRSCCRTIMKLKTGDTLALIGRLKRTRHGLTVTSERAISVHSYQRAITGGSSEQRPRRLGFRTCLACDGRSNERGRRPGAKGRANESLAEN